MSTVDASRVVQRFSAIPQEIMARLVPAMDKIGVNLVTHVVRDELSGQILNRRSGTLSNSITYTQPDVGPSSISIKVGSFSGVPYAHPLEYGFSGTVTVKAFSRTVDTVFGKKVAAFTQQVASFSRTMNVKEYAFMRRGLADQRESIIGEIQSAVKG